MQYFPIDLYEPENRTSETSIATSSFQRRISKLSQPWSRYLLWSGFGPVGITRFESKAEELAIVPMESYFRTCSSSSYDPLFISKLRIEADSD
ncbi:unnamed protein product [Arabidopsis thaliana]|uniref:Uncharacterized protein n=1 Tax=Arabidopsis thaliana TaxID=3702 RepID=Q9LRM6_ARATH|nr:unnamed protein product [Arabidopsis thaliana]